MKNLGHTIPVLLSVALLPSFAQAATIDDCQAIQDRLARYACYDSWDAASGTVRQAAPRTSNAPQPEESETSLFGRVFDRNADRDDPQEQPEASPAEEAEIAAGFGRNPSSARVIAGSEGSELIDRIAAIEERGPSMWLITLEGGQQWKQMLSKRYNLKVGDEVRIYPTRWGSSYRLTSEQVGSFIQVERVDSPSSPPAAGIGAAAPRQDAPQPAQAARMVEEERSFLGRIFSRDDENEPEATQQVTTNAAENTTEGFGRQRSEARVIEGTDGKSELVDTIAALEQRGPSMWLITLSGGQRWQQMITKQYLLDVGDEVRIYPTGWGNSYRLSSPELGSFIQVRRVD